MDPLLVQYASFFEVVELYADLRRMQIRQEQESAGQKNNKSNMIRRRASDDAGWW